MSIEPQPLSPRRSYPLLAWLMILAVVVFIVLRIRSQAQKQQQRLEPQLEAFQTRLLIGSARLHPGSREQLARQATKLAGSGSCLQQLRPVLIALELQGPEPARERLSEIREQIRTSDLPATREEKKLLGLLEEVVEQRPLTPMEEKELEDAFGWLAKLALSPPESAEHARLLGPAERTALVAQGLLVAGFVVCVLGATLLAILVTRYRKGRLRSGLTPLRGNGGVYAETVALWMLLYVGISGLASRFAGGSASILGDALLMLATLVVLVWPLLRGVSWTELRQELGLTTGKGVAWEALFGLGTNVTVLPVLLLVLVLLTMVLHQVRQYTGGSDPFGPGSTPSHPAAGILLRGSVWERVQIVLAAALVAPVVEETVFRGLLYRHLREATVKLGPTGSVLVSGVLCGLIFAAIHPQGLVAVPLLTILALAFALVRELRGSLIPCMVAHGVNNGVLTLALIGMAG